VKQKIKTKVKNAGLPRRKKMRLAKTTKEDKNWITTPYPKGHKQKDAADKKTKRPRAARKSLAGSLLIAKSKKAPAKFENTTCTIIHSL